MPVSDYLQTDDLTILLAVISATVFLLNNLYKPQPLVHPILLGRQSDVGRARNPKESAVYRNYATGLLGRFPISPAKDVHILPDFVRPEVDAPRTLWSTKLANAHLQDRAAAFATGLLRTLGARIQTASPTVLLLLNDSLEFVVADLALAAHSILSITLATSDLLDPVLDAHTPSAIITHAFLLPQLLELIYEGGERAREYAIILVGEPSPQAMASVASNVKIYNFTEIERQGFKVEKILSPLPKPSDVFSVAFYRTPGGAIQGAQLTHENVTAGVAALRALFPQTSGISSLDTISSAHSMSTPYGRAVAYLAILEGASFASIVGSEIYVKDDSTPKPQDASALATRKYPIPSPTVLFITPAHLTSAVQSILSSARSASWALFALGWRHKLVGLANGWVSNLSLWDRLVFDAARVKVLGEAGGSVREVVVSGGPLDEEIMTPARVALSVAFVNATTHPLVAAPVLATHPLDLQDIPLAASPLTAKDKPSKSPSTGKAQGKAHTGPPGVNVEVKLVGVDDEVVEGGGDPVGELVVRGPPVAGAVSLEAFARGVGLEEGSGKVQGDVVGEGAGGEGREEWVQTGYWMRVHSNGAFREV
uniref:AMP-dependent synthetase/ligase domain-containing protein n=1 Tax=Psilocybe cubensis TaxID=181762 RepID=A0A8H7Y1P5_PSICU